jgi:DNA-binding transcriptional MerR regulator
MLIGEFCRAVGRSPDTVKRWEELGLLQVRRDRRGQRRYSELHVARALQLAELGLLAQIQSRKISTLASEAPGQLGFDFSKPAQERIA